MNNNAFKLLDNEDVLIITPYHLATSFFKKALVVSMSDLLERLLHKHAALSFAQEKAYRHDPLLTQSSILLGLRHAQNTINQYYCDSEMVVFYQRFGLPYPCLIQELFQTMATDFVDLYSQYRIVSLESDRYINDIQELFKTISNTLTFHHVSLESLISPQVNQYFIPYTYLGSLYKCDVIECVCLLNEWDYTREEPHSIVNTQAFQLVDLLGKVFLSPSEDIIIEYLQIALPDSYKRQQKKMQILSSALVMHFKQSKPVEVELPVEISYFLDLTRIRNNPAALIEYLINFTDIFSSLPEKRVEAIKEALNVHLQAHYAWLKNQSSISIKSQLDSHWQYCEHAMIERDSDYQLFPVYAKSITYIEDQHE